MKGNKVLVQKENMVTTITLNRPEQLNAMDIELLQELNEVLQEVKDDDTKILVLTGAGKAFSAGGDVKTMLQSSDAEAFDDVMDTIKSISTTLYAMPKVTISAINGAAAGLGLSLALASDFVISQQDAKIAMNFIGIGLIPDGGGHFYMEQRLGTAKAKQIIWEGQMMTAKEAEGIGLIDLTSEQLDDILDPLLLKLENAPILAMIESKAILHLKQLPVLEEVLEQEKIRQAKMRETQDHKEGIDAFLNKRKPNFKGE